ncbi:hypothetical protein PHMEG_00010969 [Phytophthora megakarya]|uniref:Uncharacterized protein n=1 Tax=Phytophthora megakarya TaxID=4795 RepID=A0A225WEE2_9STRA|nr:hypothetical protein PHMEG_00010969 [Phytophthora megakarya]
MYTRFSTLEWITKPKSLFGRAVQWAVLLSSWHLIVQRIIEKECAFTRLLLSTVTNFVDIDDSLELVAPPQKGSPTARIDPQLLYAKLPLDYSGLVRRLRRTEDTGVVHGWYGVYLNGNSPCCECVPGGNNCDRRRIHRDEQRSKSRTRTGTDNLLVVGDSRLAFQQSLVVITCRNETLMAQLTYHKEVTSKLKSVKYLHIL